MGDITEGRGAGSSPDEKRRRLYERQAELLDTLLSHGAITRAQYDKSFGDLTVKMGFAEQEKK